MEGIFECVSHSPLDEMDTKPPFNTAFTINKFLKKGAFVGVNTEGRNVSTACDCVTLNELHNRIWKGIVVPFPFSCFREIQMPKHIKEIVEQEFELT
jgi:hypothetical protein